MKKRVWPKPMSDFQDVDGKWQLPFSSLSRKGDGGVYCAVCKSVIIKKASNRFFHWVTRAEYEHITGPEHQEKLILSKLAGED
jgi:hypothetical protein